MDTAPISYRPHFINFLAMTGLSGGVKTNKTQCPLSRDGASDNRRRPRGCRARGSGPRAGQGWSMLWRRWRPLVLQGVALISSLGTAGCFQQFLTLSSTRWPISAQLLGHVTPPMRPRPRSWPYHCNVIALCIEIITGILPLCAVWDIKTSFAKR